LYFYSFKFYFFKDSFLKELQIVNLS